MKNKTLSNLKKATAFAIGLAVFVCSLFTGPLNAMAADVVGEYRTETNTGDMNLIPFNNDSITADLGVGIFAHPVAIDYNKDGFTDLVVQSSNVSYPGTMVFYGSADSSDKSSDNYLLMEKGIYIGAAPSVHNPNTTGSYIYGENGELQTVLVTENRTVYPDYADKSNSFTLPSLTLPERINGHPVGSTLEFDRHTLVDVNNDGKLDIIRGICSNSEFQNSGGYNSEGLWGIGSTDYEGDGDGDPNNGWVLWAKNTSDVAYGADAAYAELMTVMVENPDGTTSALQTEGNPSPVLWDFDGDGDLDVICCTSIDDIIFFENIGGSSASNLTADGVFLCAQGVAVKKADGSNTENLEPLEVELCLPRTNLFDWDNDGDMDMLVGEEDGRVSIMENTGLLDVSGTPIFESQKFFRTPADSLKYGVLSTPFSVDWDGDGDEDIITGNTAGYIAFIENVTPAGGDLTNPSWAEPVNLTDANGEVIRIMAGYNGSPQGPPEEKWGYTVVTVADWDGDGVLDIMSNDIWGKVRWYKGIAGERYSVDGPKTVEVEWTNGSKYPSYLWWTPEEKELVTYWRSTALMIDLNEDGLTDLVMTDHEGYMAFFERYEEDGVLKLKEGARIFGDAHGNPLVLNKEVKALSGQNRAKIALVDWDGDGDLDLMRSYGAGIHYHVNVADNPDEYRFREVGAIHSRQTAGHTSCPTVCDWDKNGLPDLIVGAECGHYYYLNREFADDTVPEWKDAISISTMKGWGWISHDNSALGNLTFSEVDSSDQVASSLVPNAWAGAFSGEHVISSTDGSLTGAVAGKTTDQMQLKWMDINIAPAADSAIFYVELPKYEKSGADWALGISTVGIAQKGTDYWANMGLGGSYSYLSVYGDSWTDATMTADAAAGKSYLSDLPSGFKGYVRINFENLSYQSEGMDFANTYSFNYITFCFNSIGGDCGNLSFGGIFYIPANASDELIFECSNQYFELTRERDDVILVDKMKGWGWITKNTGDLKNLTLSADSSSEQVASAYVPDGAAGAYKGAYVLTSNDGSLTGKIAGKDTDVLYLQWIGMAVDPKIDEVIFYVELPDFAESGADWALGINGLGVTQNGADVWANLNGDTKFSYLSVYGNEWQDSVITSSDRKLSGLPSGFKGYIRLNFEDFVYWGNVDLNSAYNFTYINFVMNSIGGDCGSLSFGGIFYMPSNKSDATVMEVSGKSFELTRERDDVILVDTMKGWGWVTKNTGDLKNTALSNDASSEQVASALVPDGAAGAYKGAYVVSSKDGALTGPAANKDMDILYLQWIGLALDPTVDEVMFYVELPEYEKSGADWALGIYGLGINQNGTDVWANLNGDTKFSYLSVYGDTWQSSVITSSDRRLSGLPSGFKGYIKLDLEDFTFWSTVDLDSAYNFQYINFSINSLGGDCGDLKFGGIFYVPTNVSKATVMEVKGQSFDLLKEEPVINYGDVNSDGIIDANDVTVLRKVLLGIDTEYDGQTADCNKDGTVDIKDLVNLKNKLAT